MKSTQKIVARATCNESVQNGSISVSQNELADDTVNTEAAWESTNL